MDYDIHSALLTDPTITVYSIEIDYHNNKTAVDVLLADENDSISITFEALDNEIPIPSTTQLTAVEAWVDKKLEEYEI